MPVGRDKSYLGIVWFVATCYMCVVKNASWQVDKSAMALFTFPALSLEFSLCLLHSVKLIFLCVWIVFGRLSVCVNRICGHILLNCPAHQHPNTRAKFIVCAEVILDEEMSRFTLEKTSFEG